MLRTPLLGLLGIEHPIIQAGMGRFGSGAALAAAVSNAGAIGSIGAAKRSSEELRGELQALRRLTSRPFIVSFTKPWMQLHPECLDCALAAGARAISVAQGLPGDLVSRIHDSGALVITQVQTVEQARLAADEGADIVIAQGAEAGGLGGFGGRIGGSVLVPQVVDALSPLPVVAAGGITEGRGLAAALLLGAAGANIGTRFLASVEASLGEDWKQRLVEAPPDGTVRLDASAAFVPGDEQSPVQPLDDTFASGQGVGAIASIESAADIVLGLVRGAEQALARASTLVVETPSLVGEGVSLRA
jgi:nitronate monooxygenase/enoyl-[acyl-carrier protein] reductase II